MLDAAQDGGFPIQARFELGRRTPTRRQDLERDCHAGVLVDCAVDHGHPTRTELGNDAIQSEPQPDRAGASIAKAGLLDDVGGHCQPVDDRAVQRAQQRHAVVDHRVKIGSIQRPQQRFLQRHEGLQQRRGQTHLEIH